MAYCYKLNYSANKINEKLDKVDSAVLSVNGITPDENGNVEVLQKKDLSDIVQNYNVLKTIDSLDVTGSGEWDGVSFDFDVDFYPFNIYVHIGSVVGNQDTVVAVLRGYRANESSAYKYYEITKEMLDNTEWFYQTYTAADNIVKINVSFQRTYGTVNTSGTATFTDIKICKDTPKEMMQFNTKLKQQRPFTYCISDFPRINNEADDTGRVQRAVDFITSTLGGGTLLLDELLVIDGTVYIRKDKNTYPITIDGMCGERGSLHMFSQNGAPRGFATPKHGILRNVNGIIFSVNIDQDGKPFTTNREYDGLTMRNMLVYNNTYSVIKDNDGNITDEIFTATDITFVKEYLCISAFENINLFGIADGFINEKIIDGVYGFQDYATFRNINLLYHLRVGFQFWRADSATLDTVHCVPFFGFRQLVCAESCNCLRIKNITYAQWEIYKDGVQTHDTATCEIGDYPGVTKDTPALFALANLQVKISSIHLEHLSHTLLNCTNVIVELENFYITYSSPRLIVTNTATTRGIVRNGFYEAELPANLFYSPSEFQFKLENMRTLSEWDWSITNGYLNTKVLKYDIFPIQVMIHNDFKRIVLPEYIKMPADVRSLYEIKYFSGTDATVSYTMTNEYGITRRIVGAVVGKNDKYILTYDISSDCSSITFTICDNECNPLSSTEEINMAVFDVLLILI